MITGDYPRASLSVAKNVGMLRSPAQVVVIDIMDEQSKQAKGHGPLAIHSSVSASPSAPRHCLTTSPAAAHCLSPGSVPVQSLSSHSIHSPEMPAGRCDAMTPPAADAAAKSQACPETACPASTAAAAKDHVRSLQLSELDSHAHRAQNRHVSFRTLPDEEACHHNATLPMPPASSRASLKSIKPPSADLQCPMTDAVRPPAADRDSLSMLNFVMSTTGQALPAAEALNGLAEGQLQCALTGDAFKHMLRQCDLSVMETVMRNTVVFARMKPHQKGQVMDLLGSRGLHQVNLGQWCHVQVSTHYSLTSNNGDFSQLSGLGMAVCRVILLVRGSIPDS